MPVRKNTSGRSTTSTKSPEISLRLDGSDVQALASTERPHVTVTAGATWKRSLQLRAAEDASPALELVTLRAVPVRAGGATPVVRFHSDRENDFSRSTDIDMARTLGGHLYREVEIEAEIARTELGAISEGAPRVAGVHIAPFGARAAPALGRHFSPAFIDAQQKATGQRLHDWKYDALIAATAVALGATLVTLDDWLLGLTGLPIAICKPDHFFRRQLAIASRACDVGGRHTAEAAEVNRSSASLVSSLRL